MYVHVHVYKDYWWNFKVVWKFFSFLQQKFGIKTAGLDEKCTAMQMLVVYAKDLKEGFADFAEPVSLFLQHFTHTHIIYIYMYTLVSLKLTKL